MEMNRGWMGRWNGNISSGIWGSKEQKVSELLIGTENWTQMKFHNMEHNFLQRKRCNTCSWISKIAPGCTNPGGSQYDSFFFLSPEYGQILLTEIDPVAIFSKKSPNSFTVTCWGMAGGDAGVPLGPFGRYWNELFGLILELVPEEAGESNWQEHFPS